ncbi:MAG: penicillin-binding protein activator LpoB [Alkalinema sp. RU_4_3]|nr:penicillin-binding protein activator LpoB [Alkalinema sp. RU_4_3]
MKISSHKTKLLFRGLMALAIVGSTIEMANSPALAQAKPTKPTISIPSFKNETNWWWWKSSTATELGDALSNELAATGNFKVVERQNLQAALSEQELAELGLVKKGTGAKRGELTTAQYVILGKVTAFEEGVSKKSGGNSSGGCFLGVCVGGGKQKSEAEAYIAIDLRVVDTTTGEVAYSRTVEGRATDTSESKNSNFSVFGIGNRSNSAEEKKAPVGKALRAALIESTEYLSCVMYKKDACIDSYREKDAKRRQGTQDVLKLD